MDKKILYGFYKLQNSIKAQQAYIEQLEILLENKESTCREVLNQLKKEYVSHLNLYTDALSEGRF